jgi:hypothetical protein
MCSTYPAATWQSDTSRVVPEGPTRLPVSPTCTHRGRWAGGVGNSSQHGDKSTLPVCHQPRYRYIRERERERGRAGGWAGRYAKAGQQKQTLCNLCASQQSDTGAGRWASRPAGERIQMHPATPPYVQLGPHICPTSDTHLSTRLCVEAGGVQHQAHRHLTAAIG